MKKRGGDFVVLGRNDKKSPVFLRKQGIGTQLLGGVIRKQSFNRQLHKPNLKYKSLPRLMYVDIF